MIAAIANGDYHVNRLVNRRHAHTGGIDPTRPAIETRGIRFLLTGSSARALRSKGVNLLGGRGSDRVMRPFSWCELQAAGFSLERAINHGLLPPHYLSDDPDEALSAYVDRYLTEEIAAEGWVQVNCVSD